MITSKAPVRVIIQLTDPPLAEYDGGIAGIASPAKDSRGILDVNSSPAKAYVSYLVNQQMVFQHSLIASVPTAEIQYQYQVAYNGLAVKVPGSSIPAIEAMSGVKSISVTIRHYPTMDASIPLIGLYSGQMPTGTDEGLWAAVGGHANAGTGIKIADIDTGIDQTHPFFDPTGFSYPTGFPKGDAAYTTPKIIAARVYIRPDSPANPTFDCNCPQDHIGHGSHTAGTMAGDFGTMASLYGVDISGIAPKAQLMSYKIFYQNIVDGLDYSETPEELMAIEDVVKDGADVVNNSWGGSALDTNPTDPDIAAFTAAMHAGIVVVFSAGNNGPSVNSIGNPGNGSDFITVGASTTGRRFYYPVSETGPGTPPDTNLFGQISTGPAITVAKSGLYAPGNTGNGIGCAAFPANYFSSKIALIGRGTCAFSDKVQHAQDAGAIAVVVYNNAAGDPISMTVPGPTIPSVMVSNSDGAKLLAWYTANPGTATLTIGLMAKVTDATRVDKIASFSSKGPGGPMVIKPDVVAPGVDILSSVPGGYALYQGTSMAAPHVTGTTALLKQLHPTWTPAMIKSAIVDTAVLPDSLDASCLDILGSPAPGPMCRGAGRLNDGEDGSGDPGLVFDLSTVSLGAIYANSNHVVTVNVTNVTGASGTYAVAVDQSVTDAGVTITTDLTSNLTLAANASAPVKLTFAVSASATPQDYYGNITFEQVGGTHALHIPYWFRVLSSPAKTAGATVLLIDDDGSNYPKLGTADYRSYYTTALNSLAITYDILETDYATCISPWDVARNYDVTVLFTGDGPGWLYMCDYGIATPNVGGMNTYLGNGGRLLMTGQDAAFALAAPSGDNRNADLQVYFGSTLVQDNVFGAGLPGSPSAETMNGKSKIDFNPAGNGAKNQMSVDEVDPMYYGDIDTVPLYKAITGANLSSATVGMQTSSEPTLERVKGLPRTLWTMLAYRTTLLTFGIEGVNTVTGDLTGSQVLSASLKWLQENVSVSLSGVPSQVTMGDTVQIGALPTSSTGTGFLGYRWDWGDGVSQYPTSTAATAFHVYAHPGTYQVRVEVTTSLGHKAVSDPITIVVTKVPNPIFLPIIKR